MIEKTFSIRDNPGGLAWHIQPYEGLTKTAQLEISDKLHPRIQDFVRGFRPTKNGVYVLVNALGASEYWGSNANGDAFPERALIHAPSDWDELSPEEMARVGKSWEYGFPTFMNAHVFTHHQNKDPAKSIGDVVMAVWNPKMHRVELILYIDRSKCMAQDALHVIERIERGEFPDASMGCTPVNTRILRANGEIALIQDIKEGDEVLSHKGRKQRVISTMVRPHKGTIFNLKVFGHRTPLVLTGEHPLWLVRQEQTECRPSSSQVNRGRKQHVCAPGSVDLKKGCASCCTVPKYRFDWVRADEAHEGDYLALPLPAFETQLKLTADQARILGYYLAEGYTLKSKTGKLLGVEFCTGLHETATHEELWDLGRRIGLEDYITERDVQQRNGKYIAFHSRSVAQLCVDLCGSGAKTKKLSPDLMGIDTDILSLFMGAYANGDGGCYKGSLYLSTASEELSDQLRLVLTRLGMIASVNEIVHKPSELVTVETVEYQVWVGTDTAWKLTTSRHTFGKSERQSSKRFFYEYDGVTYLLSPIESIEEEPYDDDVYNFGVAEDNSYLVEGLAVHNCKVPFDVCLICGNKSKTRDDYCSHAQKMMNKILPDGRKVGVRNDAPRFFDISIVFIGADKTAKVMAKLAEQGHQNCLGSCCLVKTASKKRKFKTSGLGDDYPNDFTSQWGQQEKRAEKTCPCEKLNCSTCCVAGVEKYAERIFGVKHAAQKKLSEIIKEVPAGPFTKKSLPKLEESEKDIPDDILDLMGGMGPEKSLSTSGMMGIVLKPREFQRIMLIHLGKRPLADELDRKGESFRPSSRHGVEDVIPTGRELVDDRLQELLHLIGMMRDRSIAAPALHRRSTAAVSRAPRSASRHSMVERPVLKKLAALYNGYRQSLLTKAAEISNHLASDSQLRADLFDSSMVQAFTGGVVKTASASVMSPDSLAYLMGAFYQDRDLHTRNDAVLGSLAQSGIMSEVAA